MADKLGTWLVKKVKVGQWPHRKTKTVRQKVERSKLKGMKGEQISYSSCFAERPDHGSLCERKVRVGTWPFQKIYVQRFIEPEPPSNKEYRKVVTSRVIHIQGVAQRREEARGIKFHTSSYFYHEITIDIAHAICDVPDDEEAISIAKNIIGRMTRC